MKLKVGTKIKTKRCNNKTSSGCPEGEGTISVNANVAAPYHYMVDIKPSNGGAVGNYWAYDYEIFPFAQTEKEIRDEMSSLTKEYNSNISELQDQLDWMIEVGEDKFDQQEFQLYRGLSVIESTSSKLEKVKALKRLFNT